MDPSLVATMESPPAIHAPAPKRDQKPDLEAPPGRFFPRAQVGMGFGSSGVAGVYALGMDFFPLPMLGVGMEWLRAGSAELTLFGGEAENDQLEAMRMRGSVRVRADVIVMVGTLSAGVGIQHTKRVSGVPCSGCGEGGEPGTADVVTRRLGWAPAFGAEAMMYGGGKRVRAGAAARLDVVGPVATFTLGPVLGFEF